MINIDTRLLEQVTDANQLFLLMHIAKRVNAATNQCFPSNATLQSDTGWSRTKVYEVRQQLIDAGIIIITERRKENDRSQSSIITLNTDYISFFVTAKNHTKNFKEEYTPPSAIADAPVRHSEPTPSATAHTEHINQLNKLNIEQNTPISPKGEEDSFEEIGLSMEEWIEAYLRIYKRFGVQRSEADINKSYLTRKLNKWRQQDFDNKKPLNALYSILGDKWEREHRYPSATLHNLFNLDTIARWCNRIESKC